MPEQWGNSRRVVERMYIAGRLVLDTPAHFGNGDTEALTDIPLLRDSFDLKLPLLTGTSIAGALRHYLREYETGYGVAEQGDGRLLAERLFGYVDEKDAASYESWLFVEDALGEAPQEHPVEIWDGVAIDPRTRTAEEKFDIELLAAGTAFTLSFELWLRETDRTLLDALALALHGLEEGHIGLGMRKRRGLGRCHATGWQVQRYKMSKSDDFLGWLEHAPTPNRPYESDILRLLDTPSARPHQGEAFTLDATCRLDGSLLIRSDSGEGDAPDVVHLRSWRNGEARPILSGTSLAGVIRGRALRIANTLKGEEVATRLLDGMFGQRLGERDGKHNGQPMVDGRPAEEPTGSRVLVRETIIEGRVTDRVQSRVKLDRFTGGAYPGALFSEQPVFGGTQEPARVRVRLELRKTRDARHFDAEVGLLLLVLKDLWTGDLPLGGESSVGRGRLRGESATLALGQMTWTLLASPDGRLAFGGTGNPQDLEQRVGALKELR